MSTKTEINTPAIYYVLRTGETDEQGPFTETELRHRVSSGELSSDDLVAVPGSDGWERLEKWHERKAAVLDAVDAKNSCEVCGLTIPENSQACYMCGHSLVKEEKKKHGPFVTLLACIAGFIGIILLIGGIGTAFSPPRDTRSFDAYLTAQKFIQSQFPGADKFSDYSDSVVESQGDSYYVALVVDGRNAFGGPIRKRMVVEMRWVGDAWDLQNINQQP